MKTSTWSLVLGSMLLVACGSESTQQSAKAPTPQPRNASPEGAGTQGGSDVARVMIDPEIRKACGLSETETYFSYDSSRISKGSELTLTKLATCFESGPLAGRTMHLVGHADPRGDEEYNYALGGRRADAVRGALEAHGLRRARVTTTSRGEIEADGTDESGWAKDRRVDVLLGT